EKPTKLPIRRHRAYCAHLKTIWMSAFMILAFMGIKAHDHTMDNEILLNLETPSFQLLVQGTVKDTEGNPLPGANILEKGTLNGTQTDFEGNFSLSVASENSVLIFSYIGYSTVEIAYNGREHIEAVLTESASGLDEVVVVGYGTQKKATLSGSVVSADLDNLTQIPESNLSNLLAGRMSGVYVGQSTGVPGSSSNIRIRSQSSWNSTPPLYVIDGVIRDKSSFDRLDVNEIKDISVLKD